MEISTDVISLACPPVSRLPDEILCEIFLSTRLAQEYLSQPWRHPAKWDITWIKLSHVSQRWRTAALKEPNLWTNPPLWNPTWTQIMLERSKMATLPEILLDPPNMKVDVVTSVLQHVARISDLTICRTHLHHLKQILAALPSAAPNLEKLSINCRFRHFEPDDVISVVAPTAPDAYVDLTHATGSAFSQTARLRRLELSGVLLNWNQVLCGSVERFTLFGIPFDLYPRLQLRSILETMPNLTSLKLYDACPSSSLSQYPEPPLPLVRLKTLSIGPTILQAIYLLEMVAIPSATLIHVNLEYDGFLTHKTHTRRLLAAMKQTFSPTIISNPATLHERLSIDDQYLAGDIQLGISKVCNPDYELLDVYSETLRLTVADLYDEDGADFLDYFLESFDACLLFEISLNIGHDDSGLTWDVLGSRFLTTLSGIRSVVLSCYSMNNFINTLSSSTNPASTIVLPALQHICVVRSDSSHKFESSTCRNAIDKLRKLIMERRDRGVPLTSLRISGSFNLSKTYVLLLKEIVEHVVWDEAGADADFPDYRPYEHI